MNVALKRAMYQHLCHCNCDLSHWRNLFPKVKKRFQKEGRSKEFHSFAERARTGISKLNYFKGIALLSINFKLNYPRSKHISNKCSILCKAQPKLFQICANWNNRQKTVFKPKYAYRIVSLCKKCKKTSSKSKQC